MSNLIQHIFTFIIIKITEKFSFRLLDIREKFINSNICLDININSFQKLQTIICKVVITGGKHESCMYGTIETGL